MATPFDFENTNIIASANGRLSSFRAQLRSLTAPVPEIRTFIIVVPHHDRHNAPTTNLHVLRALTGLTRSLFPNARCAVFLDGLCDCEPPETRASIAELNAQLERCPPNGSTVIPPPGLFTCEKGKWTEATRGSYEAGLCAFLE